jgi:hypothetical protein
MNKCYRVGLLGLQDFNEQQHRLMTGREKNVINGAAFSELLVNMLHVSTSNDSKNSENLIFFCIMTLSLQS